MAMMVCFGSCGYMRRRRLLLAARRQRSVTEPAVYCDGSALHMYMMGYSTAPVTPRNQIPHVPAAAGPPDYNHVG